jgi:hypothetical protein
MKSTAAKIRHATRKITRKIKEALAEIRHHQTAADTNASPLTSASDRVRL